MQEKISKVIETLPEPCKTIMELYYYQELPLQQIAGQVQLSQSRVYDYIQRGQRALRRQLNPEFYDQAHLILYGKTAGSSGVS